MKVLARRTRFRRRSVGSGRAATVKPLFSGRTQQQARAAVLSGLAAVLAAHVGLAAIVETSRPEWREPEYFHRQKRLELITQRQRQQGYTRPVVAVIGSSRPQMGLSPDHLGLGTGPTDPLVFNLSQSGCLPVGERVNVSRLLASGVKPDFVLVEVLPALLADPWPVDSWLPHHRIGYSDLPRFAPYLDQPAQAWQKWLRARCLSWYSLRHQLLPNWGIMRMTPDTCRDDFLWTDMKPRGNRPFDPKEYPAEMRTRRTDQARNHYARLQTNFLIQPRIDRAYRDLLAECRNRKVSAALFVMPESPAFRSWYRPGARAEAAAYLAGLSREFDVPVFDASEWESDEMAFMDGHHLLGPAAERFSERFGRECVGPWVRGERP